MSIDQKVTIKFVDGPPPTSGSWSDITPMTGSHIPGVDTGARNGQTTFMGSNGAQTISSGTGSFGGGSGMGGGLAFRDHLGTLSSGLRGRDDAASSGSQDSLQSTIDQFNANVERQFDASAQAFEAQTAQLAMAYVDARGQALLGQEYAGTLSRVYGNLGSVGRFTQDVQYDRNGFASEPGQEGNSPSGDGGAIGGANDPGASESISGFRTPLDQQIRENSIWFGQAQKWLAYIRQVPSASSSLNLPVIDAAVSAFKSAADTDAGSPDFASRWQAATQAINTMIAVNGWTYAPAGDSAPAGPVTLATITVTPTPDELSHAGPTSKPSFDALVRGQQGRPIDLQLANIASAAYYPAMHEVDGWTRVGNAELPTYIKPNMLDDPTSGFGAGIYTDGEGHYVLAFAGTDPRSGKDWLNDGKQALGFSATQYQKTATLAHFAKLAYGDNLVITGHSLGGGEAAMAASITDTPAVTFNASGVHDHTLRANRVPPAWAKRNANDGLIRSYDVDGEIVGEMQDHRVGVLLGTLGPIWGGAALANGDLPPAMGHRIGLVDPNRGDGPVDRHGIATVIRALHHAHPDWARR